MKAEYSLYLQRGWLLLPVNKLKLPSKKKWEQIATTDQATVESWLQEDLSGDRPLGCAVGRSGLVVIDVDSPDHGKSGINGADSLRDYLAEKGQELPATFTVKTPTGGLHYYFRAPNLRGKNAFLPGVDIRACGGYVVAGGSITRKGKYEIIDDREPADAPTWFLQDYGRVKTEPIKDDFCLNVHVQPDSLSAIAEAENLLDEMETVPEGERNDTLFKLFRDFCRLGVTKQKAMDIYATDGIEIIGLDPASKEVFATLESAYAQDDFGADSPEARREQSRVAFMNAPVKELPQLSPEEKAIMDDQKKTAQNSHESLPMDWTALMSMSVPPRRWFIEGWLAADPGYTVLLSGRGGTGKSMLMLDLMQSLATGEDFLGMKVQRGCKSMFVSCEDSEEDIARRIQMRKALKNVPAGAIAVWPRWGKENIIAASNSRGILQPCPFYSTLEEVAYKHFQGSGGVLILDTISDIFAGNENDRSQVSQFIKHYLGGLALRLGVTIIVLGHPGKGTTATGKAYSGSTAWDGAFRCRWELGYRGDALGGPLVLTVAKSNSAKAGESIVMVNNEGVFTVVDTVKLQEMDKEAVYNVIAEARKGKVPYGRTERSNNPIHKAKIKDTLTGGYLSPEDINNLVNLLMEEGRVKVTKLHGISILSPTSSTEDDDMEEAPF